MRRVQNALAALALDVVIGEGGKLPLTVDVGFKVGQNRVPVTSSKRELTVGWKSPGLPPEKQSLAIMSMLLWSCSLPAGAQAVVATSLARRIQVLGERIGEMSLEGIFKTGTHRRLRSLADHAILQLYTPPNPSSCASARSHGSLISVVGPLPLKTLATSRAA